MPDFEPIADGDRLRDSQSALKADPRTNILSALTEYEKQVAQYQLVDGTPHCIRVHFETAKNLYLYAWFVYRFFPVAEKHALASLEFALRLRLASLFPSEFGIEVKRVVGMRKLMERARKEGLISNAGLRATHRWVQFRARARVSDEAVRKLLETGAESVEFEAWDVEPRAVDFLDDPLTTFTKTLPAIRNGYAHGSSTLHSSVLTTFEIVCDLVNDLYRPNAA